MRSVLWEKEEGEITAACNSHFAKNVTKKISNKQEKNVAKAMCFFKIIFLLFDIYHELPVTQKDDEGPSCILLTCVMAVTREVPPPFCFIQCRWQPHRNKKPASNLAQKQEGGL